MCPGVVGTDIGTKALSALNLMLISLFGGYVVENDPSINSGQLKTKTSAEAAGALLKFFDNTPREKDSGTFTFWDGSRIPW